MHTARNRFTDGLKSFFGLPVSPRPQVVEELGEETRFMDIRRRVRLYLRAMWNTDFNMRQTNLALADEADRHPFIENFDIHLPETVHEALDADARASGLDMYRAAAAHASAHLVYSQELFSSRSLDKWQIALISVIEDARIEALSIRRYPGLKRLWAMQHHAMPGDDKTAGDYLNRLARALLDDGYEDDDPWIMQGREQFKAGDLENPLTSRVIGIRLAETFRDKHIRFRKGVDVQRIPYRDDNRFLWSRRARPLEIINPYLKSKTSIRSDRDAEESSRVPTKAPERKKKVLGVYYYPEWNYRSQSMDPSWVTVLETPLDPDDLTIVNRIVSENHHLLARMKTLLHAIREGAARRVRKLEDGDEVDINAAIRAQISLRQGVLPDMRIMMRTERNIRDISVMMLLDLSHSMNKQVPGREQTALELTRQISVLFAEAIDAVGDAFAIHGFCSEGRHFVEYYRLKDFGQSYDEVAKGRLAGMQGNLRTRMGAAIRHATHYLDEQKSSRKLLLVLSDGAPHDVDVPSRRYLRDDTKRAVEEAGRSGIHTYCISFDPGADQYVSRIFGAKNYMVVDHIRSLPEKILMIYAALTR